MICLEAVRWTISSTSPPSCPSRHDVHLSSSLIPETCLYCLKPIFSRIASGNFSKMAFVPDKHSFDRVQVLLYSVKRFPRFCKVNQKLGLILDKHSHRRFQIAVSACSS